MAQNGRMEGLVIRRAGVRDAEDVSRIRIRSWQWAYRGLMADSVLDGLSVADGVEGWRRGLAREDRWTWIAECDGVPCGFAATGPTTDAAAAPGTAEIYAVYLEPERVGSGVGRELFGTAVRNLRHVGFSRALLWVLESNDRARRFYRSAGWTMDDAVKDEDCYGHVIREVRYSIEL